MPAAAEINAKFTSFRDSCGPPWGFWHVDAPRNSRDRPGGCGPSRGRPYCSDAAPYSPLRAGWAYTPGHSGVSRRNPRAPRGRDLRS